MINYEPYSFITLTPKGMQIAREIKRRHKILEKFFIKVLQVDPETAETTACRMEHVVDAEFLERLVQFIDFIETCPRTGRDWLQHFIEYCATSDHDRENCIRCISDCLARHEGAEPGA